MYLYGFLFLSIDLFGPCILPNFVFFRDHGCRQVSMLTAPHFKRILAMWKYADKLSCMVLLGDFWQLPVVEKGVARCDASEAWDAHVKTLPFREQVRCKCPSFRKS